MIKAALVFPVPDPSLECQKDVIKYLKEKFLVPDNSWMTIGVEGFDGKKVLTFQILACEFF